MKPHQHLYFDLEMPFLGSFPKDIFSSYFVHSQTHTQKKRKYI